MFRIHVQCIQYLLFEQLLYTLHMDYRAINFLVVSACHSVWHVILDTDWGLRLKHSRP